MGKGFCWSNWFGYISWGRYEVSEATNDEEKSTSLFYVVNKSDFSAQSTRVHEILPEQLLVVYLKRGSGVGKLNQNKVNQVASVAMMLFLIAPLAFQQ
jgi:hypothetical protein